MLYRGVEQLVARQAHNLEVVRSSRASATSKAFNSFKLNAFSFYSSPSFSQKQKGKRKITLYFYKY